VSLADTHTIVVDLGYGDAGKGTTVDWLCAQAVSAGREASVIRFNGGAQAAHNVVASDGRHHTFAQFGSGTFHGVRTHLSRFTAVDPIALAAEADRLASAGVPGVWDLVTVDEGALLTTPWHRAANRIRESRRGVDRHGSCGMGVGETVAFSLEHPDLAPRAGDVLAPVRLVSRLTALRDALTDELGDLGYEPPVSAVADAFLAFASRVSIVDPSYARSLLRAGPCFFEGAQGVLLDEWRGWHPYTTWSTTTFANALSLLEGVSAYRLGVVRTYTTRHGPGSLVTESASLSSVLSDVHNRDGPWQGPFRAGHFDAVAHRYAIEVCSGVDGLALTHLDAPVSALCDAYTDGTRRLVPGEFGDLAYQEKLTAYLSSAAPVLTPVSSWVPAVSSALAAPVVLESRGPTAADKLALSVG
jgi:adenylosuccinate synthase